MNLVDSYKRKEIASQILAMYLRAMYEEYQDNLEDLPSEEEVLSNTDKHQEFIHKVDFLVDPDIEEEIIEEYPDFFYDTKLETEELVEYLKSIIVNEDIWNQSMDILFSNTHDKRIVQIKNYVNNYGW